VLGVPVDLRADDLALLHTPHEPQADSVVLYREVGHEHRVRVILVANTDARVAEAVLDQQVLEPCPDAAVLADPDPVAGRPGPVDADVGNGEALHTAWQHRSVSKGEHRLGTGDGSQRGQGGRGTNDRDWPRDGDAGGEVRPGRKHQHLVRLRGSVNRALQRDGVVGDAVAHGGELRLHVDHPVAHVGRLGEVGRGLRVGRRSQQRHHQYQDACNHHDGSAGAEPHDETASAGRERTLPRRASVVVHDLSLPVLQPGCRVAWPRPRAWSWLPLHFGWAGAPFPRGCPEPRCPPAGNPSPRTLWP